MTLFGTFGMRGIVNSDLTPDLALKIGMGFATYLEKGTVVVGSDGRTSRDLVAYALTAGMLSCGVNVIDIGMTPTPVTMFATKKLSTNGGVMITASHNPPEYNGIKLLESNGMGLKKEKEPIIEEIIEKQEFRLKSWDDVGEIEKKDVLRAYFDEILASIDEEKIDPLTVVVDCGNSVGSLTLPYLLRKVGCHVVSLNAHVDGTFPGRGSEPTRETMKPLAAMVKHIGADFGVALDGDADRAMFVDEKGGFIQGDRSLALLVREAIAEKEGAVVTTVSTSHVIDDVAGNRVIKTAIGDLIVARTLLERDGIIGGEESGGVIFPEIIPGKSSDLAALKMAELLSGTKSLSVLMNELPQYVQYKKKVPCEDRYKEHVLRRVDESLTEYEKDTTDGVKVLTDRGWFIIRPSGTEPIIRCYAESRDKKTAKDLVESAVSLVKKTVKDVRS
jgi:phosphomannomutase/phosphoglucomutase